MTRVDQFICFTFTIQIVVNLVQNFRLPGSFSLLFFKFDGISRITISYCGIDNK